jgi:hypothetical protein
LEHIHHELYVAAREHEGREAGPTVGRTRRSQRAHKKGVCADPSGYDAVKKIKGRKRHILVDTLGLLLNVVVHPADVQDRDGAFQLLRHARQLFPFIERISGEKIFQTGVPEANVAACAAATARKPRVVARFLGWLVSCPTTCTTN